jgi:hypothetical protein
LRSFLEGGKSERGWGGGAGFVSSCLSFSSSPMIVSPFIPHPSNPNANNSRLPFSPQGYTLASVRCKMKTADKTHTTPRTQPPSPVQQSEIIKISTALEALGYSVFFFKEGTQFITVKVWR